MKRGSVVTTVIAIYLSLILVTTLLFVSGVVQGSIFYQPRVIDWFLIVFIGIAVSTSILVLTSLSTCYSLSERDPTTSMHLNFNPNLKLFEWEYTVDEWNSFLTYTYNNQRLVCPIAWRFYGQWRKLLRFITFNSKGGHAVFYRTGVLIDDLFSVHIRRKRLILCQTELINIDQQVILRLHLLAVRHDNLDSPTYAPCHVDIFVPRAIQEPKQSLLLTVDFLINNLRNISDEDDEQSSKVIHHSGKTAKIIEV